MTVRFRSFLVGALLLLTLVNSGPAWAHKFRLFAAVVGTEVQGQAYFSGGVHPADVTVELRTQSGAVISQGITDQSGSFSIPLPPKAPTDALFLHAEVDGHSAEWQLAPFSPEPAEKAPTPQANLSEGQVTAIEVALARQILPLAGRPRRPLRLVALTALTSKAVRSP
jgi:nickel transport protein